MISLVGSNNFRLRPRSTFDFQDTLYPHLRLRIVYWIGRKVAADQCILPPWSRCLLNNSENSICYWWLFQGSIFLLHKKSWISGNNSFVGAPLFKIIVVNMSLPKLATSSLPNGSVHLPLSAELAQHSNPVLQVVWSLHSWYGIPPTSSFPGHEPVMTGMSWDRPTSQ